MAKQNMVNQPLLPSLPTIADFFSPNPDAYPGAGILWNPTIIHTVSLLCFLAPEWLCCYTHTHTNTGDDDINIHPSPLFMLVVSSCHNDKSVSQY